MIPIATIGNLTRAGWAVCVVWLLGACSLQSAPPTTFKVTIANVSDLSGEDTVISTGVAITHNANLRLFEAGLPDKEMGLEGIAEDGHKWPLNAYLKRRREVFDQVIFDMPAGFDRPANIPGGKRYEFFIAASPRYPYLSLATMVGFTNDLNLMLDTDGLSGYSLYRPDGTPKSDVELKDIMNHWDVWDVGTEINEPIRVGPHQPDAPTGIDVGPPDTGLVQLYEDVRHPIDDVHEAIEVKVVNKPNAPDGTFQITVANRTDRPGLVPSALSPILAVTHGPGLSAFEQGQPDRGMGLEQLAEDGDPTRLVGNVQKHPEYYNHLVTGPGGINGSAGAVLPGASHTFEIVVDRDHPLLSMMTMYLESNDVFVTFLNRYGECGLEIYGKSDAEIAELVRRSVVFMESGTEANEEIGDGWYQGASQNEPGEGDPDSGTTRRYRKPSDPITPSDIATISIVRADGVKRRVRLRAPDGQGSRGR